MCVFVSSGCELASTKVAICRGFTQGNLLEKCKTAGPQNTYEGLLHKRRKKDVTL